jgi:hypothetical protein
MFRNLDGRRFESTKPSRGAPDPAPSSRKAAGGVSKLRQ